MKNKSTLYLVAGRVLLQLISIVTLTVTALLLNTKNGTAQTYCQPGANNCVLSGTAYGYIDQVLLQPQGEHLGSEMFNVTSSTNCGSTKQGYSNFSKVLNPVAGTEYSITASKGEEMKVGVRRGTDGFTTYYLYCYVDYNADGDFVDAGENVYAGAANTEYIRWFNFTIPAGTTTGNKRLRIRNLRSNATLNSCTNSTYGECEDYTLIVVAGCTQPATNAGNFSATPSFTSANASWTRGSGDGGVVVVARLNATLAVAPVSGNNSYTADASFGAGSPTGTGNYVIYSGTGTNVTVTDLNPGATYAIDIYEYNSAGVCYKSPGYTGNTFTTLSCTPPSQTSSGLADNPSNTTMDFSWTRGGGNKVIVLARQGGAVNSNPVSGNTYTANASFGSGSQIGTGNYVVYIGTGTSVTVTGLTPNTAYHFAAYEYNDGPPTCYNTTSPASGNATTNNVMSFLSSTTAQNNATVPPNNNNQWLVQLQVVTAGATTPMSVSQITFNTTGTTDPANDISNAKIYYTGTSSSFSAINQFGSTIAAPNGNHVVTGSQTLSTGTNYFWLTYDIPGTATLLNYAKAAVTQVVVNGISGQNGGTKTPTNTSTASRQINLIYCTPDPGNAGNVQRAHRLTATSFTGTGSTFNYSQAHSGSPDYVQQSYTGDIVKGNTYTLSVSRDAGGAAEDSRFYVWIDWNSDGDFDDAGENVMDMASPDASRTITTNVTVPLTAQAGNHKMRVWCWYQCWFGCTNPTPCAVLDGAANVGQIWDFNVNVVSSCVQPTVQASAFNVSVGVTGLDLSWTRGDGDNVIIVARQGSPVNGTPANGTTYTANAVFGSGQTVSSGNYVVYNGTGTSVTVTGLTPLNTYHFAAFEYNNAGVCYLSPAVTGNGTFCTQPATQAQNFSSGTATNTQVSVSWQRGSGSKVLVIARSGSPVSGNPVSGTSYTANAAFGSGSQIGSGNYVVYDGTGTNVVVTGLTLGTTYYFAVIEYNDGDYCYKSPALTGTATTTNVMSFVSSTTTQNNADVGPGTNDQMIVGLQVVTTGATSPISVTSITFNTNGSTQPLHDISIARIYYTGTSSTFAAINPFGPTVVGPDGSFALPGTQVLATGTNYFWLAYDIKPGATLQNYAKGAITELEMDLGVGIKTPSNTNTASRRISIIYCTPPTAGYYWNGSQYNGMITNVKITDVASSQVVFNNSAPNRVLSPIVGYDDQTNVTPPNLIPGNEYTFEITRSIDGSSNYVTKAYIDYNDNGTFENGSPEHFYNSGDTGPGTPTRTFNYTVPVSGISMGIHRLRIRNRNDNLLVNDACDDRTNCGIACGNQNIYGETEDFFINICTLPVITTQPLATSLCEQEEATLSVEATSATLMSFQWYKDNVLLPGMNSAEVTGVVSLPDDGNYKCVITNACGSVTSNEVHLTVKAKPTITVSPISAVCTGQISATLTASISSGSYTWSPNLYVTSTDGLTDVPITVETSQLTFYTVTGTGSNSCTANKVVPVATIPVGGNATPAYSIICLSNSRLLTANNAAGNSYQWQSSPDGVSSWSDIAGQTNTSYTATPAAKTYYRLVGKSNACWDVASTTAEVAVSSTPITITVIGKTDKSISLTWSPTGTSNYNVSYSGTSAGSVLAVTPPMTISGLTAKGTYNITVTQTGLPLVSCPASGDTSGVTTLCAMPTNIAVSSPGSKKLKVDWEGAAGNYRVYYRPTFVQNGYQTKDVTTTGTSGTTTINVTYNTSYEVYVVSKDCPSSGQFGQPSALYYGIVGPSSPCTPTPTINYVKSTCAGQIEVSMSGSPTGQYTIAVQRLTPTVASMYLYNVTGSYFQVNVNSPGQTFLVAVASKCITGTSDYVIYPGGITIKALCNAVPNLVLSNPTCSGFTASWNRDVCSENTVNTYQFFLRRISPSPQLTWNSYIVASPSPPITPYKLVNWMNKGAVIQCYVRSNYVCNGYIIQGPPSTTESITTLSAGCREEDESLIQPEEPAAVITSADNSEAISLYPNPNGGQFRLDISRLNNEKAEVRIEVMNVLGQTILTRVSEAKDGFGNELITLPETVSAGTYFVRVTVGNNVYSVKVNVNK